MIEVVIIGHNEGEFAEKMINSLPEKWKIVYVADRCTDNTVELLKGLNRSNLTVIESEETDGEARLTSYCRNLGLSYTSSDSDVLFLDGDRYVVSGDILKLEEWNKDIALLLLEKDPRVEGNESIIDCDYEEVIYGTVYNRFYSCGVFLKRNAINKVLNFQRRHLFPEEFQSEWGIEDTYLGDVCYHLGISCDIFKECRLQGEFSRFNVDASSFSRRLVARGKLNVRWE